MKILPMNEQPQPRFLQPQLARPHTTIILAMSADGKIADVRRSPARFGSATDKAHLEAQIAQADGVLFGAGTLRAYGTTLRIANPTLLHQRQKRGQPPQPIHIVCSRSANLDPEWAFFRQPVPRWLLTTAAGAQRWRASPRFDPICFDRILTFPQADPPTDNGVDWVATLQQMQAAGLDRLAVTGGGTLVASLLEANLVDELWLTVCPLLLGGAIAPTPVEGIGFPAALAPRLELLSVEAIDQEVFLHYRLQQNQD
jgi:5-amino-6-(5-phosphoribosylamino)uracil reductase